MPKIIENLPEKLVVESMRQVEENGYSSMTIRSVAKACHVGIGTVYNYFSSKDELVAQFMLTEWKSSMNIINSVNADRNDPFPLVRCIYNELNGYIERHRKMFSDQNAVKSFDASFRKYHSILRTQLASCLIPVCRDKFTAEFVAEALITWTTEGKKLDELWPLLEKCLN